MVHVILVSRFILASKWIIDKCHLVEIILLDLNKAFDTVYQSILLTELNATGMSFLHLFTAVHLICQTGVS